MEEGDTGKWGRGDGAGAGREDRWGGGLEREDRPGGGLGEKAWQAWQGFCSSVKIKITTEGEGERKVRLTTTATLTGGLGL